jgi:hypothetical protein
LYTTINSIKTAGAVYSELDYLNEQEAHDGSGGPRNIYVTSHGFSPEKGQQAVYQEMMDRWETLSSNHNKTPAFSLMCSFSRKELDPDTDEHAAITAAYVVDDFMRTAYEGFPYICYFQQDGVGGHLHGHILISNVNLQSGKGLTGKQTNFNFFAKEMDKALERNGIKVDYGEGKDKVTKTAVRARSHNLEHPEDKKFILEDEVKSAVRAAASGATDEKSFLEALRENHVQVVRNGHTSKPSPVGGVSTRYYTYEYDATAVPPDVTPPPRFRVRSHKLGSDYSPEELEKQFERNRILQSQQEGTVQFTGAVQQYLNEEDEHDVRSDNREFE